MKLFNTLSGLPRDQKPVVLTIGNFDGLHLGHQALITRLKDLSKKIAGSNCVMTFQDHPSNVLFPTNPIPKLITEQHKIKLLEELQIDTLIILPFTYEFSQQSPEQFLNALLEANHFSHLVLGHDAVIGKGRKGDRATVEKIAKELHFYVEYMPPVLSEHIPISSSQIRKYLQQRDLISVSQRLGRPYSIYSTVLKVESDHQEAFINISGLCLPPPGNYDVKIRVQNIETVGVAVLNNTQSIQADQPPTLKVSFLSMNKELLGSNIEVIF